MLNVRLDPSQRLPRPSASLPCNRLPFGIHQYVCNELDPEAWKKLPGLIAEKNLPCREVDGEAANRFSNSHHGSPTTMLLEYLCEDETIDTRRGIYGKTFPMTVGQLIEALKDEFKPLSERLIEYTCGKLPEEECKKYPGVSVLDDDPRQKVPDAYIYS